MTAAYSLRQWRNLFVDTKIKYDPCSSGATCSLHNDLQCYQVTPLE